MLENRFPSRRSCSVIVPSVLASAQSVIDEVRADGDAALCRYSCQFDGVDLAPEDFEISQSRQRLAVRRLPDSLKNALVQSAARIAAFCEKTTPCDQRWQDEYAAFEWTWTPIPRIGAYVPGGKARYPSSALMGVVPAKAAGCDVTVMTPPRPDDSVLAACALAEADAVFQIGGAQAIAALAYGTKTIAAVDKIVGPGGVYVDAAKRLCAKDVAIDFPAGPTELLCIAGADADAGSVAADLLAQAEHDAAACVGLLATDEALLSRVNAELKRQVANAPRRVIMGQSLVDYGFAQLVSDAQAVAFANEWAFEHVALYGSACRLASRIRNAGVVYSDTPPALGDYVLGSNHILPTGRSARAFGMLSVYDFLKPTVRVRRVRTGLERDATRIAQAEGLMGHSASLSLPEVSTP